MQVKFDFLLSKKFSSIEKTIFRLILNGIFNISELRRLLWVLSDEVIAGAIRNLVNQQILSVDLSLGVIRLSEPVAALVQKCYSNEYSVQLPEFLTPDEDSVVCIDGMDVRDIKIAILNTLLPDIDLNFLISSIDFFIKKGGGESGKQRMGGAS